MKKLLLPLILLVAGSGSGVAAGLFLFPPKSEEELAAPANPCGEVPAAVPAEEAPQLTDGAGPSGTEGFQYVRFANQFIVPVVEREVVTAMVVLSLSVEVATGEEERTFSVEPRLRDVFLQALFDHANTGGFDGMFTAEPTMERLRQSLQTAAEAAIPGLVHDVLIVEINRQDV
jgi:flagellar protein FliL